jgi:hypothetical protein
MGLTSLKKVYACHHLFVAVKNYPNDSLAGNDAGNQSKPQIIAKFD